MEHLVVDSGRDTIPPSANPKPRAGMKLDQKPEFAPPQNAPKAPLPDPAKRPRRLIFMTRPPSF